MTARMYPFIYDIDGKIKETEKRLVDLTRAVRNGEPKAQERADASGLLAEYVLYKLLQEDLPEDWSVFYNVHFKVSVPTPKDRQLDFLLIAPGCGVFNLECKAHYNWNGTEFYVGGDSNNTKPLIDQCKTAVRDLVNFFKEKGREIQGLVQRGNDGRDSLCMNVGGSLVFPVDTFTFDDFEGIVERFRGEVATFGTGYPILDHYSMSNGGLVAYIQNRSRSSRGLNRELAEEIVKLLRRSATAKLKDNETNKLPIKGLSAQMDGLVQSREELLPLIVHSQQQYFYVTGGAGTGKTWLAKSFIKRYAEANPEHKVLFVCFNKLLAASLRLDSDLAKIGNLNIVNIHRMFFERRRDAGFSDKTIAPLIQGGNVDFGQVGDKQGFLMQDCIDPNVLPDRGYDCIVVDEAQDLYQGHFAFLTSLLKDRNKSKMFICSGNEQNIYHVNGQVEGAWFGEKVRFDKSNTLRLCRNLRNSVSIHKYCKLIVGDKETLSGVSYRGQDCQIEKNRTLKQLVTALKERDGLSNKDIAVLTDIREEDTLPEIPDTPWIRYEKGDKSLDQISSKLRAWYNNEGVWTSTLHAFKGLEAPCVIVYLNNVQTQPEAVYVACTRAKFKLVIMPNNTGLKVDKPGKLLK